MNSEDKQKYLRIRISEIIPLSITIYGIAGTIYFVFYNKIKLDTFSNTLLIVSISMAVVGLFLVMNNYLKRPKPESFSNIDNDFLLEIKKQVERIEFRNREQLDYYEIRNKEQYERLREFEYKIIELVRIIEERITEQSTHELDEKQKKDLFEKITKSIEENLTKDFYEKIGDSIKYKIDEDKKNQIYSLYKRFENSVSRLESEIELLTKRSNINLIIGSIITVAALVLLGYFVVKEDFNSPNILNVTLHFIPRLSLVIFIELFSFFFLKLYRTSLAEIKYYQNELTNIEAQQLAIFIATSFGNDKDISVIINEMCSVERNFKLQKGETTVDLEKNKLDSNNLKETLKVVLDVIPKSK